MLNKAILIGNVGKDPEIRETQAGKKLASFSVATSEGFKDKNTGEWKDITEWHRVVVFNDHLAAMIQRSVCKGTQVYLEGQIKTRKWAKQDGTEAYSTEIVLSGFDAKFKIISKRKGDNQSSEGSGYSDNGGGFDADLDDEIPF